MSLTPAQSLTLKADILADPVLNAQRGILTMLRFFLT
jgi:hypothetical protein